MEINKHMDKEKIINHFKALERYNQWEENVPVILDPTKRILMVCNLYELIPYKNRQREFSVDGIIKMRQSLSLLKNH